MSTPLDRARNDDADDPVPDDEGLQAANPGPVPDEPEDVSDAGEGRLTAQPGGAIESEDEAKP